LNESIKQHYERLFKQHGKSHSAVQYSSKESQVKRFEILLEISDDIQSITDMGCGLADMLPLVRKKFGHIPYHGYDFVEEFIQNAKKVYKEDINAFFYLCDINKEIPKTRSDFVVLSGMLNNKIDDNETFTKTVLNAMWQGANKGIAFNALTSYVDYKDEHLHYHDALAIFDYCKRNLSPYVTLKHDYDVKQHSIPFEFTIFVYKNGF
jgi:hypothetical protein